LRKVKRMRYILFLCLLLASCSPQRRLTLLLTKHPELVDTTRVITYRDTTIYVPIVGTDTVYKESTIHDTITLSSGTAHATTFVVHDTLKLFVWQSDSTYKYRIDSLKLEITNCDLKIQDLEESKFVRAVKSLTLPLGIVAFIALIIVVIPRIFNKK